jgi:streptogramin lyase
MAMVSALLLATSTGCYSELDYNHIECDVNANGACPGGYACTSGLCVKETANTDAAMLDSGAAPIPDGPIADQVVFGIDAVVGDVAPIVDVLSFADTSDTADAPRIVDSSQDSRLAVDVGGEDLSIVIDTANDVPFMDAAILDSSLPDTQPDVADVTPDASVILTEIRTIESFRIPTADVVPTSIIAGPDGNLWFAEYKTKNIGRVSPTGQIKEFPTPTGVNDLTVGADKNIWYASADGGSIGRFNPTTSEVTEFTLSGIGMAGWITVGPDGNVWFTDYVNGQIGKITTAGVISVYPIDAYPRGLITGMDGNLWFACDKGVGRISTDGRYTVFSPVSDGYHWSAGAITVGGDQRIWVTFEDRPGKVGAMSTSGVGTEYRMNLYSSSLPYSYSILPGPDGNVWFADADGLARITPAGVVTVFTMPDGLFAPDYLTIGPDGYIWFTDEKANRIGRMRI